VDNSYVKEPDQHEDSIDEQVLYSWVAPSRAFKERSASIMRFYFAISLLISIIVLFFGDKILVLVIFGLLFLFYALTTTKPESVEHKITTFGIETYNTHHPWEDLEKFYFTEHFGYQVLIIIGKNYYHGYTYAVVPNNDTKKDIIALLSKFIRYQKKPDITFSDKVIAWFSKLMPEDHQKTA
jgi:hypothetical protein